MKLPVVLLACLHVSHCWKKGPAFSFPMHTFEHDRSSSLSVRLSKSTSVWFLLARPSLPRCVDGNADADAGLFNVSGG